MLFSYLLFCGLRWPELHCYASPNSNYNWPLSDPAPAIQLFVCFFKNPINFAIDSKTLDFQNVGRISIISANEPNILSRLRIMAKKIVAQQQDCSQCQRQTTTAFANKGELWVWKIMSEVKLYSFAETFEAFCKLQI